MKKIIYIFSAALLCLVSCTRENLPVETVRSTTVAPKEGDMASVSLFLPPQPASSAVRARITRRSAVIFFIFLFMEADLLFGFRYL